MKRITLDLNDLVVQGNIRRLTFAERGAFDILLEQYITRGGSLPLDVDECCDLASARTEEDRAVVKSTLSAAFRATDDGWRSTWADGLAERVGRRSDTYRENAVARWSKSRNGVDIADNACNSIGENAIAMQLHPEKCNCIGSNGIGPKIASDSADNGVDIADNSCNCIESHAIGMQLHQAECNCNAIASAGMQLHQAECNCNAIASDCMNSHGIASKSVQDGDDDAVSDVPPPYNPPIYKDSILIQRVFDSKRLSTSEDSISNKESCKTLKDYKDEESLGVEKRDCTNYHSCANRVDFALFDVENDVEAQGDGVAQPDVANNATTLDPGHGGSSRSKGWTAEEVKEKQLRGFNRFWELQPRKVDKARCWAWWQRNVRERGIAPAIINGFKAYLATCNPEDNFKYAKRPITWLRGRCWEDEGLDPSALEAVLPAREPIRDLGFEYSAENLERTLGISLPRAKSG
jgi:uncharacterized protein YdaU (DUF1376 family)